MRRTRQLGGLRVLGTFARLQANAGVRATLLSVGEDLVPRGVLERADDVMFLGYPETWRAVEGNDQRALVAERRVTYERKVRGRSVPA